MPSSMYFAYYSKPERNFKAGCLFDKLIQTLSCQCQACFSKKFLVPFQRLLVELIWICWCGYAQDDYLSYWSSYIGSKNNLLRTKESPIPVTWQIWLCFQYYNRLQHAKIQLSFAYTLKGTGTLISDCREESLLIMSFTFKCCLQLKLFTTSYHFYKSYSYCLWLPQLPILKLPLSSRVCQTDLIYLAPSVKWKFATCCYFFASIQEIQT